jgi:SecD/SecF fusion protein
VPAYATELHGAPVDVAPKERKRRSRSITTPDDPQQGVSRDEFDEMVRDIEHETKPPTETGRERARRRATAVEEQPPPPPPGTGDDTADASPEDVVMPDDAKRDRQQKRPRNRKHGRNR